MRFEGWGYGRGMRGGCFWMDGVSRDVAGSAVVLEGGDWGVRNVVILALMCDLEDLPLSFAAP